MKFFVVSDIHLGNAHCHRDAFLGFLAGLPQDAELILNGDIIDRWHADGADGHVEVLDQLREESRRRTVIWIRGNHDETYVMEDPAEITFRTSYAVGKRLFIAHGHDFDNVMPHHRVFIKVFKAMHNLRIWLGADSVHVALYAKKFPALYRVLKESVALNATEHARENGYDAVTCGHTHLVDDREIMGVRYINTGSWTEDDFHYVEVDESCICLKSFCNGTH